MKQRSYNLATITLTAFSLIISAIALFFSWTQRNADYDHAVSISAGALPLTRINKGKTSFDLEVFNTSKSNLQYFLRARTNIGCIKGANERPLFTPCDYESQVISLSKSDTRSSTYKHTIQLDVIAGTAKHLPLLHISPPNYFLMIELIDASNGHQLYKSQCFYVYHFEAKIFTIDQPIVDTSGESEKRQSACRS